MLLYDFTGLGESEGVFADTNFTSNVLDIAAAARLLEAQHEAPRTLIGHSLGGALALDAALRLPDLVNGVALFAPLIEVSRKRCPLLPPHVWFAIARVALCLSPTFESPFAVQGVAEDDPSFAFARDRFIPFCVYRSLFRLIREIRPRAARLARRRNEELDGAGAAGPLAHSPMLPHTHQAAHLVRQTHRHPPATAIGTSPPRMSIPVVKPSLTTLAQVQPSPKLLKLSVSLTRVLFRLTTASMMPWPQVTPSTVRQKL